ncbi:MAG: dTMP kinase [Acetobacteraceae bacterium]|nr:dTMP kinase [Acetobacteraceae bacterium]
MSAGVFITLEGGEGAGKSTQARLLTEHLAGRGIDVLLTREPGGSPGSERLRSLLLSGETDWSPPAEVLLHFAARAEHVECTIRPALAAGRWVVCDRFSDSTMAYQGYGQGADREMIAGLAKMIGLEPDLTLVLDVASEVAQRRLAARGGRADRYERMPAGFHDRVRAGFLEIAIADPDRCVFISADGTEADVQGRIVAAAGERLGFSRR